MIGRRRSRLRWATTKTPTRSPRTGSGIADDGALGHRRVGGDQRFDLGGRDVHAPSDDDVLGPVDESQQSGSVAIPDLRDRWSGPLEDDHHCGRSRRRTPSRRNPDSRRTRSARRTTAHRVCPTSVDLLAGLRDRRVLASTPLRSGTGNSRARSAGSGTEDRRRQERDTFVGAERVADLDAAGLPSLRSSTDQAVPTRR